jgi:hypothetical protein
MTSLIAWTDHLNEPSWISRFQEALLKGPLVDDRLQSGALPFTL